MAPYLLLLPQVMMIVMVIVYKRVFLQTRPPGATFSCTAASSNWENVTNSQLVTITALSFTLVTTSVPSSVPNMSLRAVNISITVS